MSAWQSETGAETQNKQVKPSIMYVITQYLSFVRSPDILLEVCRLFVFPCKSLGVIKAAPV